MNEKLVNTALFNYKNNIDEINAGYNILRYTQQGLIKANYNLTHAFLLWYNLNIGYEILKAAKLGQLEYNEIIP